MVRYGTVEFKKNRMRILSFRTQGNLLQYIKWYKLTLKSNKSKNGTVLIFPPHILKHCFKIIDWHILCILLI